VARTTPRRRAGAGALLVLALVAAALSASCGGSSSAAGRPNVLLLVLDTTRADRCSVNGYARETTPAMARLAKDGVVFKQAWSSANWTAPAHASLFTGVGAARHGLSTRGRGFLRGYVPTIAERFTAAGYDTGCFSNNDLVSPEFGLTRGFTRVDELYKDEQRPKPTSRGAHTLAADFAIAAHRAKRPFFVFINDVEPHQPYEPAAEDSALLLRGSPSPEEAKAAGWFPPEMVMRYDLGVEQIDDRRMALHSDLYDGEVRTLDREIGTLLDRLREAQILDSTVVILLGDHGEFLGEHRLLDHGIGLYREVLHVPLVVRHPGTFDGGRIVEDVVRIEDVAPTLLELCGLEALPDIEGLSLTSALPGRVARAVQPQNEMLSQRAARQLPRTDISFLTRGIRSAFDGAFHLLEFSDGTVELYDAVNDPGELKNVAGEHPGEVARLRALLPPQ
jgi:arylsulfatase A-like enzyme